MDFALISQGLRGTRPKDVERLLLTAQVTGTLDNSAQLADLVPSLNRTSTALAAADGSLARSVSGLDRTLQVAPAALTAIDRSLPPLVHLGTALDPSLKVAPPIITGLTSAVNRLATIVAPVERGQLVTTLDDVSAASLRAHRPRQRCSRDQGGDRLPANATSRR